MGLERVTLLLLETDIAELALPTGWIDRLTSEFLAAQSEQVVLAGLG
jgi:hypothetical protein